MNITDFMTKLTFEKNSDKSYSETGRPDFEAPQKDIVDLKPRVQPTRAIPKGKQNQSYT